jgi:putative oxidoreductase
LIPQKYENQAYAILRIVAGFLFLWHGSQKVFNIPSAGHEIPMNILLIAGPIEFFGGILIMIGMFTRWVAFIACGEMAYAYWTVHATAAILPIENHGELAILYCFFFLFISARGSGVFSIDHYLEKRKLRR